jgi:pimeloyl-ACP methyl ester carboxylesterase
MQLSHGEEGEGTPVMLLHGLTATRHYVLQGSRLLARGGYRLIGYDARGHGESPPAKDPTAYEYSDLVGDLRGMLDQLGLERPILAGSSMGAATALAFALQEPEKVSALVQITPAYDGAPRTDPEHLEEWEALAGAMDHADLDAFVELSGVNRLSEQFRDVARRAVRQRLERHEHPRAVADALRVVPRSRAFDGLDGLNDLDIPALVVGSRDETDPGHPLSVAEEYAQRLPRGRLIVEDEGESPLAWRGAQLSREIATFLATAYS